MATRANGGSVAFMLRALRYRNYRLFFGGQIVSLEGCADVISGRAEVRGTLPVRLTTNGAVH